MRDWILLLFVSLSAFGFAQEICNNAVDDDGDGLIDLNDPECICSMNNQNIDTFAYFPNPSFEFYTSCPADYSQANSLHYWQQATEGSTDFFHACDFAGPAVTTNLYPFPDGNGVTGILLYPDYKEMIGTCLNVGFLAGHTYTFQFKVGMMMLSLDSIHYNASYALADSIDIALFGAATCGNFPLSTNNCADSTGSPFYLLGKAYILADTIGYQVVQITFTPNVDTYEIIIGTDCDFPSPWPTIQETKDQNVTPFFLIDDIQYIQTIIPSIYLTKSGNYCDEDLALHVDLSEVSGGSGQWYKDGIALLNETASDLDLIAGNYGGGFYTYRYDYDTICVVDTMTVADRVDLVMTIRDTSICEGQSVILKVIGNGIAYFWNEGQGILTTNGPLAKVRPIETSTYQIIGESPNGCLDTAYVNVVVHPKPIGIVIHATPEEIINEAQFWASPSGYQYTWTFPDGSQSTMDTADYNFYAENGTYVVLLEARTDSGCIKVETYVFSIRFPGDFVYYLPNSFTPDGDERNAYFQPVFDEGLDVSRFSFSIFDRWGSLLFQTLDPAVGWDGTYKNQLLPSGIYTWKMSFGRLDINERTDLHGQVILLR